MDYSTPGFPVHHQLRELVQTDVPSSCDAIQASHPLSSPSPPAFNLSQHQGLLKWVSSQNQVAKVLELQLRHQSFQWIFRTDFLQDWARSKRRSVTLNETKPPQSTGKPSPRAVCKPTVWKPSPDCQSTDTQVLTWACGELGRGSHRRLMWISTLLLTFSVTLVTQQWS